MIPSRGQHNEFNQYGRPDWEEKGDINGPRRPPTGQHDEINYGRPKWYGDEKGGINGPRKHQKRDTEWHGACPKDKAYCAFFMPLPPLFAYCVGCKF